MARHKAVSSGGGTKTGKRGRPPTTTPAEENGSEKAVDKTPKVTKTIVKPKGKRGRPVGSTKKGKKRGAAAKTSKKRAKKESESEHEASGNDPDSGADHDSGDDDKGKAQAESD